MKTFSEFLGSGAFAPHGYCLLWDPTLVSESILANLLVAVAYFIIPIQFYVFARQAKKDNILLSKHPFSLLLIALFVFLCGGGHLIDVLVVFAPVYWVQAHWNLVTGVVSLSTAAALQYLFVIESVSKTSSKIRTGTLH